MQRPNNREARLCKCRDTESSGWRDICSGYRLERFGLMYIVIVYKGVYAVSKIFQVWEHGFQSRLGGKPYFALFILYYT